jgi:hypothetical protein
MTEGFHHRGTEVTEDWRQWVVGFAKSENRPQRAVAA